MKVLLSSAYWPNLHYFSYLLSAEEVYIEQFDHYGKQSFRNRTRILSANGVLELSIPVKKRKLKELVREVEINYSENWQTKHWRALTSAYKNSPYFEFFEDDIKLFYSQPYDLLLSYNTLQLQLILKLLQVKKELRLTSYFQKPGEYASSTDLREKIHPKIDFTFDKNKTVLLKTPYYQTFENKFGFTPNLSVLDLLFNTGLESIPYLTDSP